MTDEVWDYIFLGKELSSSSKIPADHLKQMRREFDYWYPFDMRVSILPSLQSSLWLQLLYQSTKLSLRTLHDDGLADYPEATIIFLRQGFGGLHMIFY